MITLTTEQAQQIEEALMKIADLRNLGKIQPEVIAFETLYIIRAAIAQPVLWQSKIVADCVSTVEMFNDEWRPLYAAPVRTKDLTDNEIEHLIIDQLGSWNSKDMVRDFARAVIAADRGEEQMKWHNRFLGLAKHIATWSKDTTQVGAVAVAPSKQVLETAPWKHDCAALCMNDVELWIDNCPHCGKPRTAPSEPVKQEPVAWAMTSESGEVLDCISNQYKVTQPCTVDYDEPLYAAPVRTKDLTDVEVEKVWRKHGGYMVMPIDFVRAVIAADREKNRG